MKDVINQKTDNYLFVMKRKTVMTRVKRDRLQPIRVMYVKISWSLGDGEAVTCGENALSHCFAASPL